MKIAKKINILLCDDIRQEQGNKLSFMGVYGCKIILDHIPAIFPKLCICVMLTGIVTAFSRVDVALILPNAKTIPLAISGPPDVTCGGNHNLGIIVSPARITSAGKAKIELRFDGEKKPSVIHHFEIVEKQS